MSIPSPYAQTPYAAHENGFLARRKTSPIGIGGAIAIHAGVIAVVLMMPGMPLAEKITYAPFLTPNVPIVKPPPETPPPPEHKKTVQKQIDSVDTIVPRTSGSDVVIPYRPPEPFPTPDPGLLRTDVPIPIPPIHKPVLVDSRMDPRFARNVQPDYPPARLREEEEGKVTVRVRIGIDGRVLSIEQVAASHPDFWRATQAQALKAWRFIPATRDGVPVESVREMTVYFRVQP